jgi:hypothetical protein
MNKNRFVIGCCLLALAPVCLSVSSAQDPSKSQDAAKASDSAKPPVHYYHLEFVFKELDAAGSPVNSRSYGMTVNTDPHGGQATIVSGSKSPIATGTYHTGADGDKMETQFQYLDIGIKIQARDVHETENQLTFNLKAEVSSLSGVPSAVAPADPIVRQNVCDAPVLIPIGKPTAVFKSDSLESKGSLELLVTATPLH